MYTFNVGGIPPILTIVHSTLLQSKLLMKRGKDGVSVLILLSSNQQVSCTEGHATAVKD